MITLRNRRIDRAGQVVFQADDLLELLYEGYGDISGFTVDPDPEIAMYNKALKMFTPKEKPLVPYQGEPEDIAAFDHANRTAWFMPAEYAALDIRSYVLAKCTRPEEVERVEMELAMFEERDMFDVLRFLVYFVDTLRTNKVMWGLGRGSSVASYVLYLIGIHRINSLKYSLDIREFLK